MNVFDELRELERRGERFDTIVLDPPAFAKNKAAVRKALSGYKEINLRALKLLSPGGYLVTCSCSYNVSEGDFADVLAAAAVDARADVTVVEKRMQGRDHPVLLTVPETFYLKCFILPETGVSAAVLRRRPRAARTGIVKFRNHHAHTYSSRTAAVVRLQLGVSELLEGVRRPGADARDHPLGG